MGFLLIIIGYIGALYGLIAFPKSIMSQKDLSFQNKLLYNIKAIMPNFITWSCMCSGVWIVVGLLWQHSEYGIGTSILTIFQLFYAIITFATIIYCICRKIKHLKYVMIGHILGHAVGDSIPGTIFYFIITRTHGTAHQIFTATELDILPQILCLLLGFAYTTISILIAYILIGFTAAFHKAKSSMNI